MNPNAKAWLRRLAMAGTAVLVWMVGFVAMGWPVGDGLLRMGYDVLHLCIGHQPDARVLVIAMNENTDRKLGRRQGEAFSRRLHARLLERLKQAGAERVAFDILFDLPAAEPGADEAFRAAIAAHGHVILGAAEETAGRNRALRQNVVIAPVPALRSAAEGWGLLNVAIPDPDGVVRRFQTRNEMVPAFSLVAARKESPEQAEDPEGLAWLHYQALPGGMPTVEFADCLDPEVVPDSMLRGKTVFVGGQYAADEFGRRDVFATPYSRFGAPVISGVAWHATAFLNARDNLWLVASGPVQNALWCLPLAVLVLLLFRSQRTAVAIGVWGLTSAVLAAASIYLIWNDRVLFNWLVPGLVQLPLCLLTAVVYKLAAPRIRYLNRPQRRELTEVDVFISFGTPDAAIACALQAYLRDHGRPAWLCKHHIEGGTDFIAEIESAIEQCTVILFVLSQHSLQSDYCKKELTLGISKKKRIVPLRIDDAPVARGFELLLTDIQNVEGKGRDLPVLMPEVYAAVDRAISEVRGKPSARGA